jgi:hypothetical protein
MSLRVSGYFLLFGAALIAMPSEAFASQVIECNYALSSVDRFGIRQKEDKTGKSFESNSYSVHIKRFLIIADDKKTLFISDDPKKQFDCLPYKEDGQDKKLTCIYKYNNEKEDYQFRVSIHSQSGYFDASEISFNSGESSYSSVYASYVGFCERGELPNLFSKRSPF